MNRSTRGFTLIELTTVLVIIGVLLTIVTLMMRGTSTDTDVTTVRAKFSSVAAAALDHYAGFGYFSPHVADWTVKPSELEVVAYPTAAASSSQTAVVVGETSGLVGLATYSERTGNCFYAYFGVTTPLTMLEPVSAPGPCDPLEALEDTASEIAPRS